MFFSKRQTSFRQLTLRLIRNFLFYFLVSQLALLEVSHQFLYRVHFSNLSHLHLVYRSDTTRMSNEIFISNRSTIDRRDVGKTMRPSTTRGAYNGDVHAITPTSDTNSLSLISARSKTEDADTLCRMFGFAIASRIGLSVLREPAR